MGKMFYLVLCLYIIPMWAVAIMSIIHICIRTRNKEIRFYSSTIKGYIFGIFVPGANIFVCVLSIIMILDVIACKLEKYLKQNIKNRSVCMAYRQCDLAENM